MFECEECGQQFKKAAKRCGECGCNQIQRVKANKPQYNREQREMEGMVRRAEKYGSDFLDHDFSMNG